MPPENNFKKVFLSSFVIIAFIIYVVADKFVGVKTAEFPAITPPQPVAMPEVEDDYRLVVATPKPTPAPVVTGQYKDGTYTGSVADAYYGNVQVSATIAGGKISDVQFLQYPGDRRTSIEINSQAMPFLKTEAIQAQNANVEIVSGATETSLAFRESLGSALNQAKI